MMSNRILTACLIMGIAFSIASCSKKKEPIVEPPDLTSNIDSAGITKGTAEGSTETGADEEDLVEGSTFSDPVVITFGATVTITNPLESDGVDITLVGSNVVINSTATGADYKISGTTANGSVKIYSEKKFKVTLNGANIICNDGPAINIQSKKRAFIVVADGTTNELTDGVEYAASEEEDMKGTFFAEGQVIFSGKGALTIHGKKSHAIASDDYVRIRDGNITVADAVKDGIHTNSFIADGGTIKVTSTGDGIEAEEGFVIINAGNLTLNTGEKGISASYEDEDPEIIPYININGGIIRINNEAEEGIESKNAITINNGNIAVNAFDDGLNAGTAFYMNDGYLYAHSSTNDGIDSNGPVTVTGGKLVAIGTVGPEAGIDSDGNPFKITGGIIVATGGEASSPTAASSTVHAVILGAGAADEILHLEDADKKEALTFKASAAYSTLLFACAKLKAATTYNIFTGGSLSASAPNFRGLYTGGTYTPGTKSATTFTTTTLVTNAGGTISE